MSDVSLKLLNVSGALGAFASASVSSSDLPVSIVEAPVERDVPLSTDSITFVVGGSVSIRLFNAREDLSNHPDPLFARPDASEEDELQLAPQLTYRDEAAWLKYQTIASTKITGSTDGDANTVTFGASVDAENKVEFADYRVHPSDATVIDAVTDDLGTARFAVVADHVRSLAPDDALVLRSDGNLKMQLEVAWSDVVSSAIGALARISDRLDVVHVDVDASASLSVDVSVEDAFVLVFTRPEPGRIRVALRKSTSRSVDLAAGAKVEVSIKDESALATLADEALAGLLDVPLRKVDALLGKTPDALDAAQTQLLDALLDRLGLEDGDGAIDRLEQTVNALLENVTDRVKTAVASKVSLGVSYEYSRIDTTTSLLQATFADDLLDTLHGPTVRGDLSPLLQRTTGDAPSVTLERYLRQRTIHVSKSWGFGLSLGKWFSFRGKEFTEEKWTQTQRAEGRVHLAYSGVRGYKKEAQRDETWRGELTATMRAPQPAGNATADTFTYGLGVLYEYRGDSSTVLHRVIDQACIWDVLPLSDRDAEYDRLKTLLDDASDVTSTCTLNVSGAAFLPILVKMSEGDVDAMAAAMGEAMPWDDNFAALRQNPQERRRVFGPLWKLYLTKAISDSQKVTNAAANHLENEGYDGLILQLERDGVHGDSATFSGIALRNTGVRNQWLDMVDGANRLKTAIFQRQAPKEIEAAYDELRRMWTQSQNVRGFGTYLADLAASENVPASNVERSVTVTYTVDDAERVYVVGSGRLPGPTA